MLKKVFLRTIPLLLLWGSISLSGCSLFNKKPIVLHPIEKTDIYLIPASAVIHIKAGTKVYSIDSKGNETTVAEWDKDTDITNEKNGYFLSNLYLQEVADIKVQDQ